MPECHRSDLGRRCCNVPLGRRSCSYGADSDVQKFSFPKPRRPAVLLVQPRESSERLTHLVDAAHISVPGVSVLESIIFVLAGSLILSVIVLGREVRLRRALARLLQLVLTHWRSSHTHESKPPLDPDTRRLNDDCRLR